MGKRARIEGLISRGATEAPGGDWAPLNEAIDLANNPGYGGWNVPESCGERPASEWVFRKSTLKEFQPSRRRGFRRSRHCRQPRPWRPPTCRLGDPGGGGIRQARNDGFMAANDGFQDTPKLHLWGAALLEIAKTKENPAELALQAVDYLSLALNRVPDFVEARFDRACANFLIADFAALSKSHAKMLRLSADADIRLVLKKVEGLKPAVELQGYLKKLLESDGVQVGAGK
jgi:hypothetical protein